MRNNTIVKFASLGSGSRGNATLIDDGNTCILIDLGFSAKETERRLARLDRSAADINAILVTHEHADHIHGVGPFSRKYKTPVYLTPGTSDAKRLGNIPVLRHVNRHKPFSIGSLDINPVAVPHDASEPCQYVISSGGFKVGILTDLGHITAFIRQQYARCDALLLECNHDLAMLANGPYPHGLRQRVASDQGHLNNEQAADLLTGIELERLQQLVIAHISEKNNHPDLAIKALNPVLKHWHGQLTLANQLNGFNWIQL